MGRRLQRYWWPVYLAVLIVAAGTLVVEAAVHAHKPGGTATGLRADSACAVPGAVHQVTVTNDGFNPRVIQARLCDQIAFRNESAAAVDIAVGPHDHHIAYPGMPERYLTPGDSATAVLRAKGSFELHDHLGDVFHAQLVVTPYPDSSGGGAE